MMQPNIHASSAAVAWSDLILRTRLWLEGRGVSAERLIWFGTFVSLTSYLLSNRFGLPAMALTLSIWVVYAGALPVRAFRSVVSAPLMWGFPLFAVASTLWSIEPDISQRQGVELLVFTGVGLLMARAQTARSFVAALLFTLLVCVGASLVFGERVRIGLTDEIASIGLFSSKNNFAFVTCLMMLASFAVVTDRAQSRRMRGLAVVGLLGAPAVLVKTISLGALVSGGIGCAALAAVLVYSAVVPRWRGAFLFITGLFGLAVAAFVALAVSQGINTDTLLESLGKDPGLTGRTFLWARAQSFIAERPVFGLGYQAFWVQGHVEAEGLWRYADIESRAGFHFHNLFFCHRRGARILWCCVACGTGSGRVRCDHLVGAAQSRFDQRLLFRAVRVLPDPHVRGTGFSRTVFIWRPVCAGGLGICHATFDMTEPMPFLTLAIPALNEVKSISACLESLLPQLDPQRSEVLVLDGGSTDGTQDLVRQWAERVPMLRLVVNARRLQSSACNLAARLADPRATVLVRADAHALYPADFIARCLAALRDSGATSVVVPMRTVGIAGFQRAVAAAQNSRLGNGGSAHRSGGVSAFVDHGHHAAFDLAFFRRLGGYDESFSHNEDAELDLRANRAGGRVWMCREAAITYFPRSAPWALARQYARHGAGRARTLLRHRLQPRPRQMMPVVVLAALLLSLPLAVLSPYALAVPALYVLACCLWGVAPAVRRRDAWILAMGPAAMIIHLAWATGFLRQMLARQPRAQSAMQAAC